MSRRNDLIARAAIEYVHSVKYYRKRDLQAEYVRLFQALAVLIPPVSDDLPPLTRGIIMHALAASDISPHKRRSGYRNYYAPPPPGSTQHNAIMHAVENGWMDWGGQYRTTRYAHVTEAGAIAAGDAALAAWRKWRRKTPTPRETTHDHLSQP